MEIEIEIEITPRSKPGDHPDACRPGRSRLILRSSENWTTDELREIFAAAEARDPFLLEPSFFSPNRERNGFYFKGDEEITLWTAPAR